MEGKIVTKKITELEENTTIDDTDILMAGDKGTNALKRFTIGAFLTAIKAKLAAWTFDTLQTTSKTLPGAVNELNSKTVGAVLFDGDISEIGTYTLNDDINNYKTIELVGISNVNKTMYWSYKLRAKNVTQGVISHSRNSYVTSLEYTISGRTLTVSSNDRFSIIANERQEYKQEFINKIIGYK